MFDKKLLENIVFLNEPSKIIASLEKLLNEDSFGCCAICLLCQEVEEVCLDCILIFEYKYQNIYDYWKNYEYDSDEHCISLLNLFDIKKVEETDKVKELIKFGIEYFKGLDNDINKNKQ